MPSNLTKAISVPIYIQIHTLEVPRGVIKCYHSNEHKIYIVLLEAIVYFFLVPITTLLIAVGPSN